MIDDRSWVELPYKLESDDREPLFIFQFPSFISDKDYGFYLPSIPFWIELISLVILQAMLAAAISSTIMYDLIIHKRGGKLLSFIVGYCIVIPSTLFIPFYELEVFDIRNKVMKFCVAVITPITLMFKTTEAMYGCHQKHTITSRGRYALYIASPLEFYYDSKTLKLVKCTNTDILNYLVRFGKQVFIFGLLQSFIAVYDFKPFTPPNSNEVYNMSRFFNLEQLGNNLCHAILFQCYLVVFCSGLAAVTELLIGYKTKPAMDNPIFESTSPSDFWGRRWNMIIHGVLKRGVFKPVMQFIPSKAVGVLAVFLASGLFHEWILTGVFYKHHHELDEDGLCNPPNCYDSNYGGSTVFMIWNAIIIIIETLICTWPIFQWMKYNLPSIIKAFLVISLALPIAHLFCDPYVQTDFFKDGQIGFPLVLPVV